MSERSESVEVAFTGERLHAGSALFGVDLARHRAAYAFAATLAPGGRTRADRPEAGRETARDSPHGPRRFTFRRRCRAGGL